MAGFAAESPPAWAVNLARTGDVAVLGAEDATNVRAVVSLNSTPMLMLEIGRPVDPGILDHMKRTEEAVATYERMDQSRSGLQVAFALVFALVALLVLVLDQLTKFAVRRYLGTEDERVIIPGFFKFVHWSNTGAAWSLRSLISIRKRSTSTQRQAATSAGFGKPA